MQQFRFSLVSPAFRGSHTPVSAGDPNTTATSEGIDEYQALPTPEFSSRTRMKKLISHIFITWQYMAAGFIQGFPRESAYRFWISEPSDFGSGCGVNGDTVVQVYWGHGPLGHSESQTQSLSKKSR